MADTGEITRFAKTLPGLEVAVLVPNLKGAQLAIDAGADKLTIPLSVSETHSIRNIRRTHDQVIDEAKAISDHAQKPLLNSHRPPRSHPTD